MLILLVLAFVFTFGEKEYYYSHSGNDSGNSCEKESEPCQTLAHVVDEMSQSSDSEVVINCLDGSTTLVNTSIEFSDPTMKSLTIMGSSGSVLMFSNGGQIDFTAEKVLISSFTITGSEEITIEEPLLRFNGGAMESCQAKGLKILKNNSELDSIFVVEISETSSSQFIQNEGVPGINLLKANQAEGVTFEDNSGFTYLIGMDDNQEKSPELKNVRFLENTVQESLVFIDTSILASVSNVKIFNNTFVGVEKEDKKEEEEELVVDEDEGETEANEEEIKASIFHISSSGGVSFQGVNISRIQPNIDCLVVTSPTLSIKNSIFSECQMYLDLVSESAILEDFSYQNSTKPFVVNRESLSFSVERSSILNNLPKGGLVLESFREFVSNECKYHGNKINAIHGRGGGIRIALDSKQNQNVTFLGNNHIERNKGSRGGGIYIDGEPNKDTKILLPDTTLIRDNIGDYGGGAFINITFPPDPNPDLIKNSALVTKNIGVIMAGGVFLNEFEKPPFPITIEEVVGTVTLNTAPPPADKGGPPCMFYFASEKSTGSMVCTPFEDEEQESTGQYFCDVQNCIRLKDVFGDTVVYWKYFDILFEQSGGRSFSSYSHSFNGSCFLFAYLIDDEIYHEGELIMVVDGLPREKKPVDVIYKGKGNNKHHGGDGFWEKNYQYFIDGAAGILLLCFGFMCCSCCIAMVIGCSRFCTELGRYQRKQKTQKLKREAHFSVSINSEPDMSAISVPNELDPLLPSLDEIEIEERREVISLFLETCDFIFSLSNKERLDRVKTNLKKIRSRGSELLGEMEFENDEVTPMEIFESLFQEPEVMARTDFIRVLFTFPGHKAMILEEIENEKQNKDEKEEEKEEGKRKKKRKSKSLIHLKLDKFGNRALHYACFFENEEYIQLLLDLEVNKRTKNTYGRRGRYPYQYLSEDSKMYKDVCLK